MFFRSARGITGNWNRGYGEGNVPEYRPQSVGWTPIEEMARQNRWSLLGELPRYDDGSPLDLSGGPFAPRQWRPNPPVVQGQAGYWQFWALTVTGQPARSATWRRWSVP